MAVLACLVAASLNPCVSAAPAVAGNRVTSDDPPSLSLSIAANASGVATDDQEAGLACDARIEAGGALIRLYALQSYDAGEETEDAASPWAALLPISRAGLAVSLPYLRFGATQPVGLAAFVRSPASADALLLGHSGAPLALDDPAGPACLGISVGEDYGLFVEAPAESAGLLDLGRTAAGGWFSPRGGFVSALALVSGSPADDGGPGWYDVPVPASRRAFMALSATASGTGWDVAAAAAGSAGFPGQDAGACRGEARVSGGGFRIEAEASATTATWVGLNGQTAPFLRLAVDARYARLGYAARLGVRYVQSDVTRSADGADGATVTWNGAVEGRGWFGQARAAASLQTGAGDAGTGEAGAGDAGAGAPEAGAAAVVEVDGRWKPDFAPWLALASSWRASGGQSERFDLSTQVMFGRVTRISVDSGLRFVPEGRLLRGALSITRALGSARVSCSVRTDGWTEPDAAWPASLVYSIKATTTLK